jgi:hypothetical protein
MVAFVDLMTKESEKFSSSVIDFSPTSKEACPCTCCKASIMPKKKKKIRLISAI